MEKTKELLYDAALYAMEGEDPSKAIDDMIKREQNQVVRSKGRLPRRTNGGIPDAARFAGIEDDMEYDQRKEIVDRNIEQFTKDQYAKMGIEVTGEYDDMFFSVILPEGWEIKPTDHSMWNNVVDDKDRIRINFFYKGSFWDRDAFVNFNTRYGFSVQPFDNYESDASYEDRKLKPWTVYATDCGKNIATITVYTPKDNKDYLNSDEMLRKEGIKYLDETYPEWRDINAYWG